VVMLEVAAVLRYTYTGIIEESREAMRQRSIWSKQQQAEHGVARSKHQRLVRQLKSFLYGKEIFKIQKSKQRMLFLRWRGIVAAIAISSKLVFGVRSLITFSGNIKLFKSYEQRTNEWAPYAVYVKLRKLGWRQAFLYSDLHFPISC
jgi:hypothetical protein